MRTRIIAVLLVIIAPLVLSGCAGGLLIAGATSGALSANDKRTTGTFIEDETIELKANYEISKQIGGVVNIGVTSYNRRVLITGQAPTQALKKQVLDIVSSITNVNEIIDEIKDGNPSSSAARAADTLLTAKVKAELCRLQIEGFSCLDVKVVTEDGVLYLMGLVTREQAAIAIDAARNVEGVIKVVKVFEYRD